MTRILSRVIDTPQEAPLASSTVRLAIVAREPNRGFPMKRLLITLALLATTASAPLAAGSFFAIQLQAGTADLATEASSNFGGFSPAYDHSEWGVKAEFWNMMAEDYAVTFAGGIGLFSEENKPGTNAPLNAGAFKYTQNSFFFRVGGDRVVHLGERSYLFFGPGIEYWNGKAKFEDETPPAATYKTEGTSRISLSGRIGGHMMIGEYWGLTLQAGHKIGRASYKEAGSETTWWPSSMDASGGFVYKFGE